MTSAAVMSRLQELAPDLLVLGGDYTSESVWDRLNRAQDGGFSEASRRARTDFFRLIKDFRAPLGKFAVAAPEDGLKDSDVALISDVVTGQTDYDLTDIRIIEVK